LAYAASKHETPEELRSLTHEQRIEYVNKQGKWQAKKNPRFEGKTKEQLKTYLGAIKKSSRQARRGAPGKSPAQRNDVPDSFDALEAWPQCAGVISLIQDQSACGSCWAVSTMSAASDRLCIASNATIQTQLSALDLMACCSFCGYQ